MRINSQLTFDFDFDPVTYLMHHICQPSCHDQKEGQNPGFSVKKSDKLSQFRVKKQNLLNFGGINKVGQSQKKSGTVDNIFS